MSSETYSEVKSERGKKGEEEEGVDWLVQKDEEAQPAIEVAALRSLLHLCSLVSLFILFVHLVSLLDLVIES